MKASLVLAVLLPLNFLAQLNAQAKNEDPESMIKQIYVEVSSEEGQEVDWGKVRLFLKTSHTYVHHQWAPCEWLTSKPIFHPTALLWRWL